MATWDFHGPVTVRNTQVAAAVADTELTTIDNAATAGSIAHLTTSTAVHIKIAWGEGTIGSAGTAPAAVTAVATEDATGVCVYLLAGVPFTMRAGTGKYISHVRVNTSGTPTVRVTYLN